MKIKDPLQPLTMVEHLPAACRHAAGMPVLPGIEASVQPNFKSEADLFQRNSNTMIACTNVSIT